MNETTLSIVCREPYDFEKTLRFIDGFAPMLSEQTTTRDTLTKAFVVRGRAVVARIAKRRPGALELTIFSKAPIEETIAKALADRVGFMLSVDDDMDAFAAAAARDDAFNPIAVRLRGLRHVKFPTPFEAACWGVLNQRIRLPVARKKKEALMRELGAEISFEGRSYLALPEPVSIAKAGPQKLAHLLGSERKGAYLAEVAAAFLSVDDRFLRTAPMPELEAWLREIPGVGAFTTSFVAFRGLGRHLTSPLSPKLVAIAESIYQRKLGGEGLGEIARGYGPWAGHWAVHVWASTFQALG